MYMHTVAFPLVKGVKRHTQLKIEEERLLFSSVLPTFVIIWRLTYYFVLPASRSREEKVKRGRKIIVSDLF